MSVEVQRQPDFTVQFNPEISNITTLNISNFPDNNELGNHLVFAFSVKQFDDSSLSLSTKTNIDDSGTTIGRKRPGKDSQGAILVIDLNFNSEPIPIHTGSHIVSPRGFLITDNFTLIGTSKEIAHITKEKTTKITHPFFNNIHTIDINPTDPNKVLITSTNFDTIFEWNLKQNKPSWIWHAWEHGFRISPDGIIYTQNPEELHNLHIAGYTEITPEEKLGQNAKPVIFIDKHALPKLKHRLGTRRQTTHLSAATWGHDGQILATLFHQGSLVEINKGTGQTTPLINGMINPHAITRMPEGAYVVTDTKNGKAYLLNNQFIPNTIIDFFDLVHKETNEQTICWLQGVLPLEDNLLIAIDSNHHQFILIDLTSKTKRIIPYHEKWAVQTVQKINTSLPK